MSTTRTSLLFSFAEKYALLLLGVGSSMIIARLLTPSDTGVYAVGAVLLGIAQVVRDFGVGQYLIQERDLTSTKLAAVLATSFLFAWALAALIGIASVPLAQFYHERRLAAVLQLLALNFALIPFTSVTLPMLRRQMRFGAICAINLAHGVSGALVAIGLASAGLGYISLAWAALAATLAALLVSLCFRPSELPWLPRLAGVREVLRFGAYATGGTLIDEIGVAAPELIVGKLLGMAEVGIFGKAGAMLAVFNQAITSAVSPVIFSLWSQHAREEHDLRVAYLRTVGYLTALAWPFFGFVGLMAAPLVHLLYGAQWDRAVPLIRVMCLSSALFSMFSMARYLFVASGQVRVQARLDASVVPVRIAMLLVAAPFGLAWVAWAVVLGTLFRCGLTYRFLARSCKLAWRELLAAVFKSAALTLCAVLAPLAVLLTLDPARAQGVLGLGIAAPGALAGWLLGAVLLKHDIALELLLARRKVVGFALAVRAGFK